MTEYCKNCGELCSGKLNIEVCKGIYYNFCSNCFSLFRYLPNKEIAKILKINKYGVTI